MTGENVVEPLEPNESTSEAAVESNGWLDNGRDVTLMSIIGAGGVVSAVTFITSLEIFDATEKTANLISGGAGLGTLVVATTIALINRN